jgi:hypothetical protein
MVGATAAAPPPAKAAKTRRAPAKPAKTEGVSAEAAQKMFLKHMGGRANAKEALAKVNRDLGVLLGGAHGLHTLLNTFSAPASGVHPQIHSIETSYHKVRMHLTLHDENGAQIGHTEREITRDDEGDLHVHQEKLFLKTTDGGNATGKGLGPKIIASNFDGYEKMGIKSASIHAAYVGSYVWAKMGYTASPKDMAKVNAAFKQHLIEQGVKPPGDFQTIKQIAEYAAGGAKHGKDFLMKVGEVDAVPDWNGQGWLGKVIIDRADPGYQDMNRYLGRT